MAKTTKAAKAWQAGRSASENEYVRRLIEDEELRDNLRTAAHSAKKAYGRISNGKGPAKALMDDRKVHRELRTAAESLREASDQIRGKRKRRPLLKLVFIGLIGAGIALAISEDLRKQVLDRLFGAEEEFEYTSTTAPSSDS